MKLSFSFFSPLALSFFFLLSSSHGLRVGFYKDSCPEVETIVRETVISYFKKDPTITASVLRLHFHDCFVRGCDGSVLINSTKTNLAEKEAKPNHTLRGFYVIDSAKAAVENKCPEIVSCADIAALAARDAVSLVRNSSGQEWEVGEGRQLVRGGDGGRDGVVSTKSEALKNLPSPLEGIAELKKLFGSKGLTMKDLVVLSGGHAIGRSHCDAFSNRLYNFTGKGDMDPSLDPSYAAQLKKSASQGT
uniref:peroxidase n=1 Tax=Ananas comosus var. bracteatus TaxID=296719 RepID=A0A6V7QE18_ANACO|nr:unnamed protein product [Ananas comosus var. bracteatus]